MASKKRAAAKKRAKKTVAAKHGVCFVIMPFGGWLDDYYDTIYSPAIEASGLDPHRADDLFRPSTIVNDIWAYTKAAKLLVADLSGKNPNVFYELGLAHALGKPAILVAESMEDIPFDLRALRVIVYDKNAPDWGALLRDKIEASIGEVLKAPVAAVLPAFLNVKGGDSKASLTVHEKELIEIRQELDLLRRELRGRDSRRDRGRVDIGPAEALQMIDDLLARGIPENLIARRLERLGPPMSWVREQLRERKKHSTVQAVGLP